MTNLYVVVNLPQAPAMGMIQALWWITLKWWIRCRCYSMPHCPFKSQGSKGNFYTQGLKDIFLGISFNILVNHHIFNAIGTLANPDQQKVWMKLKQVNQVSRTPVAVKLRSTLAHSAHAAVAKLQSFTLSLDFQLFQASWLFTCHMISANLNACSITQQSSPTYPDWSHTQFPVPSTNLN